MGAANHVRDGTVLLLGNALHLLNDLIRQMNGDGRADCISHALYLIIYHNMSSVSKANRLAP